MNYKCYNCQTDLPTAEPQTWFCNEDCKNKYWEKENVKEKPKRTIKDVQAGLVKLGEKARSETVLATLADDDAFFEARNIFVPPKRPIQGLDD